MAIWRSGLLEALVGGQLDESGLTAAALRRLCTQSVAENDQLEFKAESAYEVQPKNREISWRHEQEFAKDVCALANHQGGIILIGVEEASGVAVQVTVGKRPPAEVEHHRLHQALQTHAAPAPRVAYIAIPVDGVGYASAVVVPPSDDAPHGVDFAPRSQRRPRCFPVRDGSHTRYLGEAELADRYQRRFLGDSRRQARERRVVSEGQAALAESGQVWCYIAVVPAVTADATMNRAVAHEFSQWLHQVDFQSPLNSSPAPSGSPIPGPGRLTFTEHPYRDDQDAAAPRERYLELHADGAFFGAQASSLEEQRGVSRLAVVDDVVLLVEMGLRWAVERVGHWGTAAVFGGIARSDGVYDRLELWGDLYGRNRRLPNTRPVRTATAQTVADLSASDTVQDRLAVAYEVGSGLVQHFGIPEMVQLSPTGAINVDAWLGNHGLMTAWARRYDVEIDNSSLRRTR